MRALRNCDIKKSACHLAPEMLRNGACSMPPSAPTLRNRQLTPSPIRARAHGSSLSERASLTSPPSAWSPPLSQSQGRRRTCEERVWWRCAEGALVLGLLLRLRHRLVGRLHGVAARLTSSAAQAASERCDQARDARRRTSSKPVRNGAGARAARVRNPKKRCVPPKFLFS